MDKNAADTLLRAVGQEIWEIQITATAAGDTLLDVPEPTEKKHRIYGTFQLATIELFERIGTSIQGDAVVFVREQLELTSQIEYNDVRYEITEEKVIEPLHAGKSYAYVLHKYPGAGE